jgi:uncharacterized protein
MELSNSFTIPVPVDEAWKVLLDVERIAPCMPGATLESSEADEYRGSVKVKVGPITVTYRGTARVTETDEEGHRAVVEASGKETRGTGTARATVTTTLAGRGAETEVSVATNLAITGKPAQFGRGVMADVASKLIDRFAACLADELGTVQAVEPMPVTLAPGTGETGETGEAGEAPSAPAVAAEVRPAPATVGGGTVTDLGARRRSPSAEPIDLLEVAGEPVAKRLLPVAGVLATVVLLLWLLRRRRG